MVESLLKTSSVHQFGPVKWLYARDGTCNLFLAVEPLTGRRRLHVTERRTASDFAEELRILVEQDYPNVEKVVLVTDNLNTHTLAALYARLEPAHARRIVARIEWHYAPEHGSWLNIAECELSVLARQCLNRRIADKTTLEQAASVQGPVADSRLSSA